MLLDSNIVIYAADPSHDKLREWLDGKPLAVSSITRIEVLGYHGLVPAMATGLEKFFSGITVYPVSEAIVERSIALRRSRKISLADSVIAATVLENHLPLVTRNIKDYRLVPDLEIVNPFDEF
jgi:predicted nucleic acid-binding protein